MQVRVTPSGFMDKDTDPQYVGKGNYVDANDIRHRQTDGANFGGIMGVKGNSLQITIPQAAATTKLYRVYVTVSGLISGGGVPADDNSGKIVYEDTSGTKTIVNAVADQNQTLLNYSNAIKGLILAAGGGGTAFTFTSLTSITSTYGYFEFYQNSITDNNYVVYHISDPGERDLCTITLIRDYISANVDFTVIGSAEFQEDLFVFSASEDVNHPTGLRPVGEIGVIYYDNANDSYSYTRLLRTRELDFRRENRFEIEVEVIGNRIGLYCTDGNSLPRTFYINRPVTVGNPYSTDQMLTINDGDYNLYTVDLETRLFLSNPNATISFVNIKENAGNLTAGTKRYTGCFISGKTKSEYLYPTNQISVYSQSFGKAYLISGDEPGNLTNKGITLSVNNIPADIYEYFELVAIEYEGATISAKTVQRYPIKEGQTALLVEHTDLGQDNIPLSLNEILAITSKYTKAATLKLFDNRLTASNLTEQLDLNLSEWATTIKHSLEQKDLDSVGLMGSDFSAAEPNYKFGEYMNPENVHSYTGYMMNDTYRFGIQVKYKDSGKWSVPYYVDDIRFDFLNYNVTDNSSVPASWRRTANNIDQNLTKGSTAGVGSNLDTDLALYTRAYYVSFNNINMDYIETSTGKRIRELISGFRFVRSERIPEVITTGLLVIGQSDSKSNVIPYPTPGDKILALTGSDKPDYGFLCSPDIYFGTTQYTYRAGDKLKVIGSYKGINSSATGTSTSGRSDTGYKYSVSNDSSRYIDYCGYFDDNKFAYTDVTINAHAELTGIGSVDLAGQPVSKARNETGGTAFITRVSNFQHAFKFPASIFRTFGDIDVQNEDNGAYYAQVFRDLGANLKYPKNKEFSTYESTGHIYTLTGAENGLLTQSVFGGDVFTQKTHMQLYMADTYQSAAERGGYGWGFYSQNITNTQMRTLDQHNNEFSGPGFLFPQNTDKSNSSPYGTPSFKDGSFGAGLIYWLEQWPEVSNQTNYNEGYSWQDKVLVETGYDVNNTYDGRKPATIIWSGSKIVGSKVDSYRIFQPLDFADLDLTYGEIAHHDVINNAFYTWQDYSFQRQYFRDASLVNSKEGSEIVVGAGSILGAPGVELTSIGCDKKWSIILGHNTNGKETAYWYNDRLQKFIRLAGDGVQVLSDRGMVSFFTTEGKYNRDNYKPLSGYGVHAVWNDKYSEAIFSFKYTKPLSEVDSYFTIVYDELKNGFVSFHSYNPNIYLRYQNTFFSTKPDEQNKIYLHDSGTEAEYYGTQNEGNITMIMNYDGNISKNFEALQVNSTKIPFYTWLYTEDHESYLDETEFVERETLWYSPIKNDILTAPFSSNSEDSTRLFGKYLKVKLSLEAAGHNQKLINMIVKFRPMSRLYNQ